MNADAACGYVLEGFLSRADHVPGQDAERYAVARSRARGNPMTNSVMAAPTARPVSDLVDTVRSSAPDDRRFTNKTGENAGFRMPRAAADFLE